MHKLRKSPNIVERQIISLGVRKQKGHKCDRHYRIKRPSNEGEHIIHFFLNDLLTTMAQAT